MDADIREGTGSVVLFIGDSHMQQFWPRIALAHSTLKERARPLQMLTAGGSPSLPKVNRLDPGYACDKLFDYAMQIACNPKVGTVVFSCWWEHYFIPCFLGGDNPDDLYSIGGDPKKALRPGTPDFEKVFAGFGEAVARLVRAGKEVVVLLPTPVCEDWNPARISPRFFFGAPVRQVVVQRATFEAYIRPVKELLTREVVANGGRVIDPLDYFAENDRFLALAPDGRPRYKDANHLRPFYVIEQAIFIDDILRAPDSVVP